MTTAEKVRARLGELEPVFRDVRRLQARRDELQTVEQAKAAFDHLVADEEALLADLDQRKRGLEIELWRRARLGGAGPHLPLDPGQAVPQRAQHRGRQVERGQPVFSLAR